MSAHARAGSDPNRPGSDDSRARGFLFALWIACLLAGLGCAWVFVAGLLRDSHFEEAELAVDLGRDGAWRGVDFRVWGGGPYVLWLTTLRPDPPFAEGEPPEPRDAEPQPRDADPETRDPDPSARAPSRFAGRIAVRVLDPGGGVSLERAYEANRLEHRASGGMTWTRLEELRLDGLPFRSWRLEGRIVEGDPTFESGPGLRSRLLLRRDRPEVGMGGLINYVMVIPAALFLLLSLGLALGLARRGGSRAPAWISGLLLAALVGLFAL